MECLHSIGVPSKAQYLSLCACVCNVPSRPGVLYAKAAMMRALMPVPITANIKICCEHKNDEKDGSKAQHV
jgi:hypothetical protein